MDRAMWEVRRRQHDAAHDVAVENLRQLAKWGVQDHSLIYWLSILLEECGEVAEAVMVRSPDLTLAEEMFVDEVYQLGLRAKAYIEGRTPDGISRVNDATHAINLDAEIIQVAAVAVAFVENVRRAAREECVA